MVFKGRFFSSKKSDTSSPEGSNSPRSFGSNSPIRSEKKKVKSNSKDDQQSTSSSPSLSGFSSSCRQTQVKDSPKQLLSHQQKNKDEKKDVKGKETKINNQTPSPVKPSLESSSSSPSSSKSRKGAELKEVPASVSPILASSLGLNRIKTRSGPLPQESFFGFGRDKGSSLGASNLSKPGGDGGSGLGKSLNKNEAVDLKKMGAMENVRVGSWADNMSNSDSMSTETVPSIDHSPLVQARSRLQNGESSSEAGKVILQLFSASIIIDLRSRLVAQVA